MQKKELDLDLQEKISWFRYLPQLLSNFEAYLKFYYRLEQDSHRKFILMNTLTIEKKDRINMLHVSSYNRR